MKTTYSKIYKALDKAGVIDKIINTYSYDYNVITIKEYIVYGIELNVDFFNSKTFSDMKYWKTPLADLKGRISQEIQLEYARLLLKEINKEIAPLNYLISVMV